MVDIVGDSGGDLLDGTDGADTIRGNGGNDTINGKGGNDLLYGDDGDDLIDPGTGTDRVEGGNGNDTVVFSAVLWSNPLPPVGLIDGGAGYDTVDLRNVGPASAGTIEAEPGRNAFGLYVGSQRFELLNVERLLFGDADNMVGVPPGFTGTVELRAGGGNDTITAVGPSSFYGEGGNDIFFLSGVFGSTVSGIVDGGTGTDRLDLNIAFTVDLASGIATAGGATYSVKGFEHVRAAATGGYVTTILGAGAAETFEVNPQFNDGSVGVIFDGRGGNDILRGGKGSDELRGGDGNDQLWGGAGVNRLEGGAGDDRLGIDGSFGVAAGNIFDGGSGYDTLEPVEGVDISAATLISIEEIRITGGPVLMTVAQMNGVSALHALDSTLDVAEFTLVDAGAVALSGKSVWETSFILSNAGNSFDLTGAIIGNVLERDGFTISGRDGADTIIAAGGNDDIVGGGGNDVIDGAGGNDVIRGGAGRDTLSGGAGNDSFFIDEVSHLVAGEVYDGGAGVDAIYLPNGNFNLATLDVTITGIEEITLGAGVLSVTAAQLGQFSTFGAGTYVLTSGGNVSLTGGKLLADARFILSDLGNGFDLGGVVSGRGEVTGGAGADSIVGSAFNDILSGGGGDDVIQGGNGNDQLSGGTGNNKLYGGAGDDIYYLGSSADLVFENAGAGIDLVSIENNFYLFANVENLSLAGSGNYFGVGNDLANMIFGNSGENLLIAGTGDDIVRGGDARDAIFGEQGADQLFGDGGIDYIVGGAGNDILAGGKDADEIYGGDGDDYIFGGNNGGLFADADFSTDILVGGAGNDFINGGESFYRDGYGLGDYDLMYGNEGNDSYVVDTPDDLVFEQANEGIDTVYANINGAGYYLYDNIEGLVLEGDTPFGVGNALANLMIGSGSANYLLGGAGNDSLNGIGGNDVLFGEAGNDIFVFTQGMGSDVIGDFTRGQDRIDLSALGITSLAQISGRFVQDGNVGAIQLATGDVIVLHNVQMNQLTAGDFIFGSAAKEVGIADKVAAEAPSLSVDFQAPLTDGERHGGALWTPQDYSLPQLFD